MRKEEFEYFLPPELIAQEPPSRRGLSNLMVVERKNRGILHKKFKDIVEFLRKEDVIVLNDVKVIPARLRGEKKETGGKVEILLVKDKGENIWEIMAKGRKLKEGIKIIFGEDIEGEIMKDLGSRKIIKFKLNHPLHEILKDIGETPLPPYIKKPTKRSFERYQTLYARKGMAVAAPTAGFHFSRGILRKIRNKGVKIAFLTLFVGPGTFIPIKTENVEDHKMEEEYYQIGNKSCRVINESKEKGGRIIAVGTTVVRTLETSAKDGKVYPGEGETSLFIIPGYRFKIVDVLLTNFHLPSSTPFLLVNAFAGKELIFKAYDEAIKRKYRFYSFGDAMLIV